MLRCCLPRARAAAGAPAGSLCRRQSSTLGLDAFYREEAEADSPPTPGTRSTVVAKVLDHSIDLKNVRPGATVAVPYEVTASPSARAIWHTAFYGHDRIHTSSKFARGIGMQDMVLPFSLMLHICGAMHADKATQQLKWERAYYLWPVFPLDTLTKRFTIRSLRATSDGKHTAYVIFSEILNQRDKVCFHGEQTFLYPVAPEVAFKGPGPSMPQASAADDEIAQSLKMHIISQSDQLAKLGSRTLRRLHAEQCIIHGLTRPLGLETSMGLSSMARLTHNRHFNTARYSEDELLVPGSLVYAHATSLAARDVHECLHEELEECSFIHPLHPNDPMGAVSYIKDVTVHLNGVLEKISLTTIGIKQSDVTREFHNCQLPVELFTRRGLTTKRVEEICKDRCPELEGKIVVITHRTLLRCRPNQPAVFLL